MLLSIFALFTSVLPHQNVFAEVDETDTLEGECAKIEGNDLDALLCGAVLELQAKVADLEAKTAIPPEANEVSKELDEQVAEEVMEETPQEPMASPLIQLVTGVNPDEIQCGSSRVLIFKASNSRPACVEESSFSILIGRGWLAIYDPTLDIATEETEETEPLDDAAAEEETIMNGEAEVESGKTQGNNYTADLSESMEMGAN